MAVDVKQRGKGIAKMFMNKAEELAKIGDAKSVRVDTNVMNIPMNSLFPKIGYSFAGSIRLMSKPPDMKFNCYEKRIDR